MGVLDPELVDWYRHCREEDAVFYSDLKRDLAREEAEDVRSDPDRG